MAVNVESDCKSHKEREFMVKNPCIKEEKFDIRGVKVLTKNDWNRLQYKVHQHEIEAENERLEKEKKEKIKECSHDMVKHWTNTVLGARQKKLEERARRLEEEERIRKEADLKEAEYQAEKRRKAIEEAKRKQYYQTDRVKNFHSGLMYSEVLKEREAQVELKRLKDLAECNKDDEFALKAKREYEEDLKREQDKAANHRRKVKENSEFIKQQIKYNQEQREKEYQEQLTEGENIRRLAIANALEKQRIDQIEREEQRCNRKDLIQQMEDVNRMREIERLKNEEDDEEIRIFAAAKKKMIKLRMARERELQEEKQSHLEKIKEKLSAQMKAQKDDEDCRIKKAVDEKEQKRELDDAEKLRKRMDQLRQIEKFRVDTMNRLHQDKLQDKQRDADSLYARRQADAVLRENEAKRMLQRMEEAKKVALENLETAKQLKGTDECTMLRKRQMLEDNQRLLDLEEKVFQEYAQKVIAYSEQGGRNTYPMRVAAARGVGGGLGPILPGGSGGGCLRPSYKTADGKQVELPSYQTDGTKEMKNNLNSDTNNNLGFVWSDQK